MGFAMAFGPVAWVLCSGELDLYCVTLDDAHIYCLEIYPLRGRSKGLSIAASSNWINAFIGEHPSIFILATISLLVH